MRFANTWQIESSCRLLKFVPSGKFGVGIPVKEKSIPPGS